MMLIKIVIAGVLLTLLLVFNGCAENEAYEPAEGLEIEDPVRLEEESLTDTANENVYTSVDGNLSIRVEDIIYADSIPAEVNTFFSADNDKEDQQGIFFADTKLELRDSESHYVALFISLFEIEDIYITDPRGFQGEPALLITDEGSVEERIITQFQYTGEPLKVKDIRAIPEETSGVIVFAHDKKEGPREIHYFYGFQKDEHHEAEKGLIIIALPKDY